MKAIMLMFDSFNRNILSAYECDWTKTPNFKGTAVRFNHNKPSSKSWGEMIFSGGGLFVHNSRIEPLARRVVFIICNI
jgi:hypothetical protein